MTARPGEWMRLSACLWRYVREGETWPQSRIEIERLGCAYERYRWRIGSQWGEASSLEEAQRAVAVDVAGAAP